MNKKRRTTIGSIDASGMIHSVIAVIARTHELTHLQATSAKEVHDLLHSRKPLQCLVINLGSGDISGMEYITQLHTLRPETEVIVIFDDPSPAVYDRMTWLGVMEIITHPYELDDISAALKRALASNRNQRLQAMKLAGTRRKEGPLRLLIFHSSDELFETVTALARDERHHVERAQTKEEWLKMLYVGLYDICLVSEQNLHACTPHQLTNVLPSNGPGPILCITTAIPLTFPEEIRGLFSFVVTLSDDPLGEEISQKIGEVYPRYAVQRKELIPRSGVKGFKNPPLPRSSRYSKPPTLSAGHRLLYPVLLILSIIILLTVVMSSLFRPKESPRPSPGSVPQVTSQDSTTRDSSDHPVTE